jgi:hypothetical protein
LENADTMGERIARIGRIETDFFYLNARIFKQKIKKKSVSICRIRPIRSPIVSAFSKSFLIQTQKSTIVKGFG